MIKANKDNRINAYVCPNLHVTVTMDRDKGTTPMFIGCPQCPKPDGEKQESATMASSMMYRVNQTKEASHEWYTPNASEMEDFEHDMHKFTFKALADHVKQGGLLMRERKGWQRLQELKRSWTMYQRDLMSDDYLPGCRNIRAEVMELHRDNAGLVSKADFQHFEIIIKKEVDNV